MHTHTYTCVTPAQTEGRLIHWVSFDDGRADTVFPGQVRHSHALTKGHALTKPVDTLPIEHEGKQL